jgi:hypothetical protein
MVRFLCQHSTHLHHVEDQVSTFSGYLPWIIPFDIFSWPVVEIHSFPERIIYETDELRAYELLTAYLRGKRTARRC